MTPAPVLPEELSALLDGELEPDRAAEVRAAMSRDPDLQRELGSLAEVRSLVAGLPAVDPPFGFYERMLRQPRRRRWRAPLAGGAVAALVASFVVLAGLTPVGDAIAPPVQAFAERHEEMAAAAGADGPTSTAAPVGNDVTADPELPVFTAVDPDEAAVAAAADGLAVPDAFAGMAPMATYVADDAVHAVYASDALMVSLYEQPGRVDWADLPDGARMAIGESPAWAMTTDDLEVVVMERQTVVYTLVFEIDTGVHTEALMDAMAEMPPPAEPTWTDHGMSAAQRIAEAFGLTG